MCNKSNLWLGKGSEFCQQNWPCVSSCVSLYLHCYQHHILVWQQTWLGISIHISCLFRYIYLDRSERIAYSEEGWESTKKVGQEKSPLTCLFTVLRWKCIKSVGKCQNIKCCINACEVKCSDRSSEMCKIGVVNKTRYLDVLLADLHDHLKNLNPWNYSARPDHQHKRQKM